MVLKDAWEGLKLTWDEWHMIVCGWGDGIAFTKTNTQELIDAYGATIIKELHYYKGGIALGRLTWALVICSVLIRLVE